MEVRQVPPGYAFMGDTGFYRVLSVDEKSKTADVLRTTGDRRTVSLYAMIRRLVDVEEFEGYVESWQRRHGSKTKAQVDAEREAARRRGRIG